MIQHTFNQISPHVYWLSCDSTTDRPTLGVITGSRCSLLVDAGNSAAHAQVLLREIAQHHLSAPGFLMLTHWHWDHIFGAATLPWPALAHTETARIVKVMAQLDWSDAALDQRVADGIEIAFCRDMIKAELPDRSDLIIRPPEIAFDTRVEIDLGDVTCQLVHVGGDHAPDASIVYVPEDKIMFLGDCLSDDLYHGSRRCTTTNLFTLLDRLLAYDVTTYLDGHSPEPISRAQLIEEATLLKTIGLTVEAYGDDRTAILATLPNVLGIAVNDDHIEIVDAFLEGLRRPIVESVL